MLSLICWLTLAARWATPGPAASPAFAGSSAAASLFPGWAHVLLCVNGISFSCRSPASLRLEVVRDRCGLLFILTLPCFLSSCPSQVLFQLTYRGFRPHIRGRQQAPLFYNTHHGSVSLVDPCMTNTTCIYQTLCWALGIKMVSQRSTHLLYRA